MTYRVIALAKQLLETIPQDEVRDLIGLLEYYNDGFKEDDRVRAMQNGSQRPKNQSLESEIVHNYEKSLGSQNVYLTSSQNVCRCCGR
jgi:hypothetical protein